MAKSKEELEFIRCLRSILDNLINTKSLNDIRNLLSQFPWLVNLTNEDCELPIHMVCKNYFPGAIDLLCEYNSWLDYGDQIGNLPIHIAAKYDQHLAIQELYENNVDINSRANQAQYTPLHVAVFNKSYNALTTLISLGANRNIEDIRGNTPVYYAELNYWQAKIILNEKSDSKAKWLRA